MGKEMDKEHIFGKMVINLMGHGKMIKYQVVENLYLQMALLYLKSLKMIK